MKSFATLRRNSFLIIFSAVAFLALVACEEFVDIDPPKTVLIGETVYASDATASAALSAAYVKLAGSYFGAGSSSLLVLNGLSADELIPANTVTDALREFHTNNLTSMNTHIASIWASGYNIVHQCNAILDGLASSEGLTAPVREQIEGEALFIRAYIHFHLANLYGDIPYVKGTDYRDNANVSRIPKTDVMSNAIADLLEAQDKLATDYSFAKQERVRVNKSAATALSARVYLYMEDWASAEIQSSAVIEQTGLYELVPNLDDVFLKGSREAILQWMPGIPGQNAAEATYFVLTGPPNIVSLSGELVEQFEDGDKRAAQWVGSFMNAAGTWYFPKKYKLKVPTEVSQEYSMVVRLAEMYLIRSEARAMQDKLATAINDLDRIRQRAGLPLLAEINPSISKSALLIAIENERRSEMFAENHRWYDLNRTNRADAVLGFKKSTWQASDQLYPLPEAELLINPLLKPQNPGY